MLETLFLRSYILSHMLQDKIIFFSRSPLLQTLALTDAKASPNPPPQQQNQPASDGYAFFKCTPRDSIARTIGRQI